MARWEEALDAKLDLYTLVSSGRADRYLKGWVQAEQATGHLPTHDSWHDMADRLSTTAFNADPVWVDPDLQTVWEAAVPSFQPEALHAQDLITDCGFVYLPRPHTTRDLHGRTASFRAFGWATTMLDWRSGEDADEPWEANFPGVLVFVFHALGDVDHYDTGTSMGRYNDDGTTMELAYANAGLRRGDLILDFVYPWPFGARIDEDGIRRLPLKHRPGGARDMYEVDPFGLHGVTGAAEATGERSPDAESIEQHVQCLWRLMQQTITTHTQFRATRPVRRRYERAKVDERAITVIQLRRPNTPAAGEHRDVEWSHRWLVAGHWRNQWYPTLKLHRQIWISPYVKGPEDAPLQVRKERVFALTR
jgi:hypothetical protein